MYVEGLSEAHRNLITHISDFDRFSLVVTPVQIYNLTPFLWTFDTPSPIQFTLFTFDRAPHWNLTFFASNNSNT